MPSPHLVAYFPLVDLRERAVLLIGHVTSGLWLPPGGHVEAGEDPLRTVEREVVEELGRPARYTAWQGGRPLFLPVARTVGAHPHTSRLIGQLLSSPGVRARASHAGRAGPAR